MLDLFLLRKEYKKKKIMMHVVKQVELGIIIVLLLWILSVK